MGWVYPGAGWLTIEHTFVQGGAVGYRGKLLEREEARRLRAVGWTMPDIAGELGVSRPSVSLWTRDVVVARGPRRVRRPREPNALERRKQAEIAELLEAGQARIGQLSERDLLVAGVALYAGRAPRAGTPSASPIATCGWSCCSVPGCGGSSTSWKTVSVSASIFTPGWTSKRRCVSGRRPPIFHSNSSALLTGRRPIEVFD